MKFLNTAAASWLKVYLAEIGVLIIAEDTVLGLDWKLVASAALVATLPVLINALNPEDKRYGRKK